MRFPSGLAYGSSYTLGRFPPNGTSTAVPVNIHHLPVHANILIKIRINYPTCYHSDISTHVLILLESTIRFYRLANYIRTNSIKLVESRFIRHFTIYTFSLSNEYLTNVFSRKNKKQRPCPGRPSEAFSRLLPLISPALRELDCRKQQM